MDENFDFSGYATRANMRCTDGRIILHSAFRNQNLTEVPIVWNHRHEDPDNILGKGVLEHREDGVYVYGYLNDTQKAVNMKQALLHGDIKQLSIYANHLVENGRNVIDGVIKEVSLVIAGANPGAFIDSVIAHGDGGMGVSDQESGIVFTEPFIDSVVSHSDDGTPIVDREQGTIYTGETITVANKDNTDNDLLHAEEETSETVKEPDLAGKTIGEIFDSMPEAYKIVTVGMVEEALRQYDQEKSSEDEEPTKEESSVKHNAFDEATKNKENVLCHADGVEILKMAKSYGGGSLKAAIEAYASEKGATLSHDDLTDLGITEIGTLFPEYKDVRPGAPEMITDDQGWVNHIMNKVHKSPISRIRTRQADVRNISSRAKGYVKGAEKTISGNIGLLTRTTDPVTVYARTDLNRDDTIDIESFDVVQYMYNIDNMALHEKLATAMLMGDGLDTDAEDKIDETKIRPVWTDDELYTIHVDLDLDTMRSELQGTNTSANFGENYIFAESVIQTALYAREKYKGSGNLVFYCDPHTVNVMLLARDMNGHRVFSNVTDLKSALNVLDIITVEQMAGRTRVSGTGAKAKTKKLLGVFYNFADYSLGSAKGGKLTHITDFDINFNKLQSLLETRLSGANTRVYSAIALEQDVTEEESL